MVNEADIITPGAAAKWLDVLEHLKDHTIIIFTTNSLEKLPQRLRDRCEVFEFDASAFILPAAQSLVNRVWIGENCAGPPPDIQELGELRDANGEYSFRRILQVLTPIIRNGGKMNPKPVLTSTTIQNPVKVNKVVNDRHLSALKAWETRRARKAVPCG